MPCNQYFNQLYEFFFATLRQGKLRPCLLINMKKLYITVWFHCQSENHKVAKYFKHRANQHPYCISLYLHPVYSTNYNMLILLNINVPDKILWPSDIKGCPKIWNFFVQICNRKKPGFFTVSSPPGKKYGMGRKPDFSPIIQLLIFIGCVPPFT